MDESSHPGLRFCVGDIVIPSKKSYPILLRSGPYEKISNWKSCPSWSYDSMAVIVDIKVDMKSIGEVMVKVMTPTATGWTDWWNLSRCSDI
jgi:hypothetical protein